MKGDLITFFLDGATKSPTRDSGTSEPSLSISSSTSSASAGGREKTNCTSGAGPCGGSRGTWASAAAIRASIYSIDLILQSCFALDGLLKQLRLLHELGFQIAPHISIVLNSHHHRASFLGLVAQLHCKRSGLKGGLVLLVVLRAHDLLQKCNEPINASRWERRNRARRRSANRASRQRLGQRRENLRRASRRVRPGVLTLIRPVGRVRGSRPWRGLPLCPTMKGSGSGAS